MSSTSAQEKIWLDQKGRWLSDSIQAKQYVVVTQEENHNTKVETFDLNGKKIEIGHYFYYAEEPKSRIREGEFITFYPEGQVKAVRNVKANRLEGVYTEYNPDGSILLTRNFRTGKPDGMLLQYYPSGKLRREEKYKEGKLISGKLYAEDGSKLKYEPYEVMPQFPGGIKELARLVKQELRYPQEVRSENIEEKVLIEFFVDTNGSMTAPRVKNMVHPALEKEALRVFRIIAVKNKWSPGKQDGVAKRMKYIFPISFRL